MSDLSPSPSRQLPTPVGGTGGGGRGGGVGWWWGEKI